MACVAQCGDCTIIDMPVLTTSNLMIHLLCMLVGVVKFVLATAVAYQIACAAGPVKV